MNAIKSSLKTVRASFETVPFLKFMVKAGVYIFAAGGLLWIVGGLIPTLSTFGWGGYSSLNFVKTIFATFGRIGIAAGLLFALINEEDLILMISSAVISVGALIISIVELAGPRYFASLESWLFFLIFGGLTALTLITFLNSDKMKEQREQARIRAQQAAQQAAAQAAAAQAAAAQQVQLIECPNCKGPVPINAGFCPNCGAPNPAMQYQPMAPPMAPMTPAAPPIAPMAPPMAPMIPAPVPMPEPAPAPMPEPAPAPMPEPAPAPMPEPAPAPTAKMCPVCGSQLPMDAMFCAQCGTKQQ